MVEVGATGNRERERKLRKYLCISTASENIGEVLLSPSCYQQGQSVVVLGKWPITIFIRVNVNVEQSVAITSVLALALVRWKLDTRTFPISHCSSLKE